MRGSNRAGGKDGGDAYASKAPSEEGSTAACKGDAEMVGIKGGRSQSSGTKVSAGPSHQVSLISKVVRKPHTFQITLSLYAVALSPS